MASSKLRETAVRFAKDLLFFHYYPRIYDKAAKKSIESGKVLFIEQKEEHIPDSFRLLYDQIGSLEGMNCEYISLGQGRVPMTTYIRNCAQMIEKLAVAEYAFLNDASNETSCVKLRPETRMAQLWHGCGAFKKWGMSTADLKFGGNRESLLRHPFYRNLSLVTVSSPDVVWAYEEAMALQDEPGTVNPIGVSRTDVFFDQDFLDGARAKLEEAVPAARGKKVILYAPTFRGHVRNAKGPDKLDLDAMAKSLGRDYVLLVKQHPFVKNRPAVPASAAEFAFDVTDDLAIETLIACADVCISDYSSLIFEYSLFERPMIFFAFDLDDYADWRGFFYNYDELTPGPVLKETDQVIAQIREWEQSFDVSEVRAFKEKFMGACDGHSTERIIDFMMSKDVDSQAAESCEGKA